MSDSISPIAGPVAPHAGAWIETIMGLSTTILVLVAPHAGAWIETAYAIKLLIIILVAPHAGAWIETMSYESWRTKILRVAPHAGAWIETQAPLPVQVPALSRPTRARGLKR